jgi:protein involved in polysaccharide export with SLBB domain
MAPIKRAAWQERLTLGPGDAIDISLLGHPESTRTNLVVGPDGRINYLQLQDFPVTGLTIDELRAKLDAQIGLYFVGGVRSMIIPAQFKDAYLSHVPIVRGSLAQPKIAVVSYRQVVAGRDPDVTLEPGDIVYVPFVPYQTLLKYVNLILDSFARAEAINEGARAVSRNVVPVGINIGLGVGR